MGNKSLDEIKKGFYSLFSNHDNELSKLPKKGVEIKTGIAAILVNIKRFKGELLDKLTSELGKVPFQPDSEPYYDREYRHLLDFVPKRFSYDMISRGEKYTKTENGIEEQAVNKPTDEQATKMREYNSYSSQYVEVCIDAIKLETLRKNLEDRKTYNLSVNQLTMLGL